MALSFDKQALPKADSFPEYPESWYWLGLEMRRWFAAGYLADENTKLGSPTYRPATMVDHDKEVADYLHWALALSRHSKPAG